ncbi:NADH:flavin oxidoreductase/NADH oxidase family protein [Endozoicomonas arenosclerae]|uniref:NADH:flavin oxidoreductase/NADH oxidase family protein n=1 Tax=Endozoicomonas arenosclerae TaxID=1633495 RepID=UPI000780604E|nr:NADH:flavin oxidoreductase/NADH oxidase family protein [Endozoicomonas arenosclerae]
MQTASKLDTELPLTSSVTLKNRFFKAAMSEQLGDSDHNPTPELFKLYETWAKGGAGICVTGNLMVDRNALGEPKNVVLDHQSDLSKFREWVRHGTENNTQLWAQLNHPGKQIPSFISSEPVAPSAIALEGELEKGFKKPRAMTEQEINDVIKAFARTAELAKEVGFQGVQIHSAHGYLVNQFLSPRHNQRDDQWGGSVENRQRFVIEVFKAIRNAVGDTFPIGIKLNSADFMKDGLSEEESMGVVKALSEAGIDLIEVSGGTYESPAMMGVDLKESTKKREAYFLEYAIKARQHTNKVLVVTGGFRSAAAMNEALQENACDMIGLGRPMAMQPDLPQKAMDNPDFKIEVAIKSTGFEILDKIAMLDLTWYEAQLSLMGKGKQPNSSLSGWNVLLQTLGNMGSYAFRKRRA